MNLRKKIFTSLFSIYVHLLVNVLCPVHCIEKSCDDCELDIMGRGDAYINI